jgi:hypothetical protein
VAARVEVQRLSRTISGWSAVIGAIALATGHNRLCVYAWRLCGWGGIGAVYGYESGTRGLPAEPVALWRAGVRWPFWRSFIWHGVFGVLSELVDRRRG